MAIDRRRLATRLLRTLSAPAHLSDLGRRLVLRRDQLLALCDELAREGLVTIDGDLVTPIRQAADESSGPRWSERAPWISESVMREARRLVSLRAPPLRERDQYHVTADDLARRAAFVLDVDDVDGRDVLFVGDDDLCSALVARVGSPNRVVVVDGDERVLDAVTRAAATAAVDVTPVHYDLRRFVTDGLPAALMGRFDLFVTDPPYTESGMMLFLAFGLTALRPGPGVSAVAAVPWLEREQWSHELLFKVQRAFVTQGFVLTDVRRAFHAYPEADHIFSSLVRAVAIAGPRAPGKLLESYNESKLYASRRWSLPSGGSHDP